MTSIGRRTYPVPAAVRERLRASGLTFSELRVADTGKASEPTIRALAAGCGCGDPEVTSWASGVRDRIYAPPVIPGFSDVPGPYYGLLDDEYDGELVMAVQRQNRRAGSDALMRPSSVSPNQGKGAAPAG